MQNITQLRTSAENLVDLGYIQPALGVSVKSVRLVAFIPGWVTLKTLKRARRSAQAEVRRVLCMCCSTSTVCALTAFNHSSLIIFFLMWPVEV